VEISEVPRKVTLSWAKAHRRWRKIYRGRQWHSFVCDKSDREAFRRAVEEMEAWRKKIDEEIKSQELEREAVAATVELQGRINQQVDQLKFLSNFFETRGDVEKVDSIEAEIRKLRHDPARLKLFEKPVLAIEPFAVELAAQRLSEKPQEATKQIAQCLEDFKAFKRSQLDEGRITAPRYDEIARNVDVFANWLGAATTDSINGDTLPTFRQFLISSYKNLRAKNIFETTKQFLRWCYERERLESLPRNFAARDLAFRTTLKEIVIWKHDEWKVTFEKAPPRIRLYLLLMLNCGAYQTDIAELRQNEVDWQSGRITRRRTKTNQFEKVPVVNYLLWPTTFELLKQFRSKEGDLVILTETGRKLVCNSIREDGKLSKDDSVGTIWKRFERAISTPLPPLKCLRKTGATHLAEQFGTNYATLYLGHAPRTLAERHYIAPRQERFDEAIKWLGSKFGQ
jgi:integrase